MRDSLCAFKNFQVRKILASQELLTWILEDDDPAQVVSKTVTANPFANPGVPDFGVLPAGNSQIPGFNLPSDFPATFELSLYVFKKKQYAKQYFFRPDDMTASEQNENFFERNRREAFEISFENKTSPVFDKPASSLNLSGTYF